MKESALPLHIPFIKHYVIAGRAYIVHWWILPMLSSLTIIIHFLQMNGRMRYRISSKPPVTFYLLEYKIGKSRIQQSYRKTAQTATLWHTAHGMHQNGQKITKHFVAWGFLKLCR